ncbi:Hypothetical predicted protein [Paramuricea clavata]|uniref:Uncharacterized protein n=1 Tax=Paramuricea clavata TaxID=317549 RepID=A0A7D9HES4_PARCT|nr:Hypothetical predicted protein [Paramuricea clavata]
MSDKQQDIQPEILAMDKPDLPVEQEPRKDETTTEGLEETGSTASKKDNFNDDQSSILSIQSSLALKRHLIESKFWKEGPEFLKADKSTWPEKLPTTVVDEFEHSEGKRVSKTHLTQSPNEDTTSEVFMDPTKYYCLQRLVRVTVWILRFARNCKLSKERRVLSATLVSEDITEAETVWLR